MVGVTGGKNQKIRDLNRINPKSCVSRDGFMVCDVVAPESDGEFWGSRGHPGESYLIGRVHRRQRKPLFAAQSVLEMQSSFNLSCRI